MLFAALGPTESYMRRCVRVEGVNADDLVVCTGREVFSIGREAHGMDGARVMAEGGQLLGLGVVGVVRVQDCFDGPYAHVAVCSSSVSPGRRGGAYEASFAWGCA
jgi:hypothetical protein